MSQPWIDFILAHRLVGFYDQPVRLRSGRLSHWYINWRKVAEDVYLLDRATDLLLASIQERGWQPRCIYGVPEGATKLALLAQLKWAQRSSDYAPGSHVLAMGRGKPKEHGAPRDRYFLGQPQGPTVVVEDVTTTGASLWRTVQQLRDLQVPVLGAVSLTDRRERQDDNTHISQTFAEAQIPFVAMSTATDLLPAAIEALRPPAALAEAVRAEMTWD